jgi:hypothetical protein
MGVLRSERGVALGLIIITSIVFGIAAFGLLYSATNQGEQGQFLGEGRLRARYAAEAGLVMAMQEQFVNPADCAFGAGPPFNYFLDTDNDATNDTKVSVTLVPCPSAGTASKMQAKVSW